MNRVQRVALRFAGSGRDCFVFRCERDTGAVGCASAGIFSARAGSCQGAGQSDENPFAPTPAPPLPPGMTGSDANDPRFKLTPGMYDAGETSMGMKHLLLLKKPDAFQLGTADPDDPKVQKMIGQLGIGVGMKMPKELQLVIAQLAFANSDLAFQGNHLFQGNFYGVNIYDISNPAQAALVTSMVCPGGQGDVSVYKNLLFMSVEMPNGRLDCGAQGFPPNLRRHLGRCKKKERRIPVAQKDRFRGVRIFDISDIKNPKQVAAVQTCRGSHTHTLVVDPNDKDNVYIYVSGTSFVRQAEELAGCSGEKPDKDPEYGAVSHRRDQGSGGGAAGREGGVEPSRIYRSADGRAERPEQRRQPWQGRRGEEAAGHRPVPRHHGVLGDWAGGGRVLGQWHSARHQGPGASEARGCGERSELFLLALGFVLERWDESGVHRRVGRRPGCAVPSERSEQVGRGCDLPSEGRQADLRELLQAAGRAGRHGELRGAQRLAGSGSRPRYRSAGLVSGRRLGDGLHRRGASV